MEKRGQVWVETVIYTLIAFIMIGAVLAYARPKLEEFQDKAIIDQTIAALEEINTVIISLVQGGSGNKRIPQLGIKKGTLKIDGREGQDKIIFEMDSKYAYGEAGQNITVGNLITYTEKKGKSNLVTLTLNYTTRYDITYDGINELKLIPKAATPYKIAISNNGKQTSIEKTRIDFEVI